MIFFKNILIDPNNLSNNFEYFFISNILRKIYFTRINSKFKMDNFQMANEIVRRITNELPILLHRIRMSNDADELNNLRQQYAVLIGLLQLIQSDLNDPSMINFYRSRNN